MIVTRFAPSPTGELHMGHAAAALFAYRAAQEAGGRFLLRIEDIDASRCLPACEEGIYDFLRWLGIDWPEPVRRQSEHMDDYRAALDRLRGKGLLYPCFCTRKEVEAEAKASSSAPHHHPDTVLYAGTCRALTPKEREEKEAQRAPVWRLDMQKAVALAGGNLRWHDRTAGDIAARPEQLGDVVLARRDMPTSYHLSVVVDDALQGITLVTRGQDLMAATDLHRLLQALLDLPVPTYHHHPLILGPDGKRLAKRHRAASLRSLREDGKTAEDVIKEVHAAIKSLCH